VGAGSSQEAEFTLLANIPAGTWTLVADCFVLQSVDMRFEIFQRKAAGGDVPIVMWDHHFEPAATLSLQTYEVTGDGPQVDASTGDQLILRYTGTNSTQATAWFPNGEGAVLGGRIPYIDLPQ
jgi:hypothetical protein